MYVFILIILFINSLSATQGSDSQSRGERQNKFLWPFIIMVPEECISQNEQEGTCYTSKDCRTRGGIASGTCASGYAVCCLFEQSCGTSSSENNTYFTSENNSPSTGHDSGSCTHEIIFPKDVCQVRLDFLEFNLGVPNDEGECKEEFMTISGGVSPQVPTICGANIGQHMYLHTDGDSTSIKIRAYRSTSGSSKWKIKIRHIPCGAINSAPRSCLQYFTDDIGDVLSFNYVGTSPNVAPITGTQLSGQMYSICIEPSTEYCSISWSRGSSKGNYGFTLSGAASNIGPDQAGDINEGIFGSTDCGHDYIIIPDGNYRDNIGEKRSEDRFCGLGFPNTVTSSSRPFMLYVRTDENEGEDTLNQGFHLKYKANICT